MCLLLKLSCLYHNERSEWKQILEYDNYATQSTLIPPPTRDLRTTRGVTPYLHATHQVAAWVKYRHLTNRTALFWNFDWWSHLVSGLELGSDASYSSMLFAPPHLNRPSSSIHDSLPQLLAPPSLSPTPIPSPFPWIGNSVNIHIADCAYLL